MSRKEYLGEVLGTFIMVLFGTGAGASTVLFSSHQGLLQVALIWGVAVTLAIYMARHLSCAHFNPAVTVAMAVSGRMSLKKIWGYVIAQFVGAFLAGVTAYFLFSTAIAAFEGAHGIVRGSFESVETAKIFGLYYIQPDSITPINMWGAAATEMLGTFLLVLAVFLLTEDCNVGKPDDNMTPLFIGLVVTSVICLIAPLTQAGLNPARDLGPRLVLYIFGWNDWAFPDRHGGFWVYILSPILGGIIAAIIFTKVIEPAMRSNNGFNCK